MTYASILWRVELRALLGLLACSIAMALYFGVLSAAAGAASGPQGVAVAWMIGSSTFFLGFIPVTFIGVPLYSYLLYRSRATWPNVLAVGALPAVPVAIFSYSVAWLILLCGLLVAAVTHVLVRARLLTARSSGP
jgi:hypothetical protein